MRKVFAIASLLALLPAAANAAEPVGVWNAGEGRSKVQIEPCGEELCGRIIWLSEPNDDSGSPKLDRNNPEPSRQHQTLLGLQILSELKPSSDKDNQWEGHVYNPEDGNTYNVYLRPKNKSMEVEGCLAFFCRTQVWPRLKADEAGQSAAGSGQSAAGSGQ